MRFNGWKIPKREDPAQSSGSCLYSFEQTKTEVDKNSPERIKNNNGETVGKIAANRSNPPFPPVCQRTSRQLYRGWTKERRSDSCLDRAAVTRASA
jgi:hypothetical protein